MLELNAKENATVEVIEGNFPLGQQNVIKINVLDKIIAERINIINTGVCSTEYNYYSYGKFDSDKDINKLTLNLKQGSIVNIVDGAGQNFSKCLHCQSSKSNDLGLVELLPDKFSVQENVEYILSFYAKGTATITADNSYDEFINIEVNCKDWTFFEQKFTSLSDVFDLYISMNANEECYIDNVMLFESSNEIKMESNAITAEIDIINPCNNVSIDRIINWDKKDDVISVYMYMPPITVVDYKDSITCNLKIYQRLIPKIQTTVGDFFYSEDKEIIYNSDNFNLSGYIIPIDLDVSLNVDRI